MSSHIKNKVSCLLCRSEVSVNNLQIHYNSKQCQSGGKASNIGQIKKFEKICIHCGEHTTNKRHESLCKMNINRQTPCNQFIDKNNIKTEYIVSRETREKQSVAGTGRKNSEQNIKNISIAMQKAVLDHPDSYRGTYNRGNVKELICSNGFKVLGSWEQLFVEFCISNNITIKQPEIPFAYEFEGTRSYFPDFYLPDTDVYIEVKGMQKDKDLAKWNSLINTHSKELVVITKTAINLIKKNKFTLDSIADFKYSI